MKIMLFSLPGIGQNEESLFPLGLGYLNASLKANHCVEAHHFNDLRQARREITSRVKIYKPDIVGFSCNAFNRGFVRDGINLVKGINKNIEIIVGGVHASFCYEQVLSSYGADIIVIGEGENTLVNLCDAIKNNKPLFDVAGIAYKEGNKAVLSSPASFIDDLDTLPIPDYSYAASYIEKSRMGFLITSRGCPVRCTFCSTSSFWGQKIRMHSVKRVVNEMQVLIDQFKVRKIFFHDDTFNLGIERVKDFCKEVVSRNIDIEWGCSCRVTPVSEEMISTMVAAGCRHICWGIESGSESMLKRINKNISLKQIRNAFEISKKFTKVMSVGAFAMVGNPGETEETIKETAGFIDTLSLTDCPSTSILYVLPGTVLYENLKQKEHIKDSDWVKHSSIPLYTLENAYKTLNRWLNIIKNSGIRIPFEPKNHFWYSIMATSDLNRYLNKYAIIKKYLIHPGSLISKIINQIKKIALNIKYSFNLKGHLLWWRA